MGSGVDECDRLDACQLKPFAAANVLARHLIFSQHHVGLRFGETGPITLIRARGQAVLLAPDQPVQLILCRLAAVRARQSMGPLLWFFVVKVAFFHGKPSSVNFQYGTAAGGTANAWANFSVNFSRGDSFLFGVHCA
jgi:hypothetical protein